MRKIKQKIKSKSTQKQLRQYMQLRYLEIVRYLNSNAENSERNVLYLINHEPDFYAEIEQLKEAQALKKKKQEYNSIDMSKSETDKYYDKLQADMRKIVDAINHEINKSSTSDTALKQRSTHIARLQSKLDEIIAMQNLLVDFVEQKKRPVGRPKKTQPEKEISEDETIKEE